MSAALKWNLVSVDDYLASELASPVKHEYVGGVLHAMAGARVAHDFICRNVILTLGPRLRGKRCRLHTSDMKIRVDLDRETRFYYPDASVVCGPFERTATFQADPTVLVEVLSDSTRRADTGEKKDAYLSIPSLRVYVLIEQDSPFVVVFRRVGSEFVREVYEGLHTVVSLPEVEADLPLNEVYDGVDFVPESRLES